MCRGPLINCTFKFYISTEKNSLYYLSIIIQLILFIIVIVINLLYIININSYYIYYLIIFKFNSFRFVKQLSILSFLDIQCEYNFNIQVCIENIMFWSLLNYLLNYNYFIYSFCNIVVLLPT